MIKNEDFTKNYLDKIIFASEEHTVDEWLGAFKKLSEIMKEFNLDHDLYTHSMGVESLKVNLIKNESLVINEVTRLNACAKIALDLSIEIVQISSRNEFKYDDVSGLIRQAWWELISLFDYSSDLYLNIYSLCLFKNLALTLEKSVKIVADRLSGNPSTIPDDSMGKVEFILKDQDFSE